MVNPSWLFCPLPWSMARLAVLTSLLSTLRPDTGKKLKLLDFGSLNNLQVTRPTAGMDFGTPAGAIGITLLHCSIFNKPWTPPPKKKHLIILSSGVFACVHVCMLSRFSWVWFFATLWTIAHQAPLSMGFSKQQYWRGLPCPPPGVFPSPGIEPAFFMSPELTDGFFTTGDTWEA